MNFAREDIVWRRIAIGSFATLVFVALAWNAAGFAIDMTSLEQGPDSLGMFVGTAIVTVMYGAVPLIVSFGVAAAAGFGPVSSARPCAWVNAIIAAICGAALVVVGAMCFSRTEAEAALGIATVISGVVLLTPLVWCIWRAALGSSGANRDPHHRPA